MKSAPSQGELDKLEVDINQRGGTLEIKLVPKIMRRGTVSFDIYVPPTVREISEKTVSGRVELRQIFPNVEQILKTVSGRIETDNAADLTASSTSGSIEFEFSGGNLDLRTVSGSIEGDVHSVDDDGEISISSVSGSVKLEVPETFDAALNLHSTSGSVSVDLPVTITMSKRNKLEGTTGKGLIPVEIGTTSGSIRLEKR